MMNSISKFQIGLIGAFVLFIIAGLVAFATYKGNNTQNSLPAIVIWGTVSSETFNDFLQAYNVTRPSQLQITYIEKKEDSLSTEYTEALALGNGPDALLMPSDLVFENEQKIATIPFENLPIRSLRDIFIPLAEQYIRPQGVLAIPFAIDPLVMYWNRDMFTNAGLATYPRTWGEVQNLAPKFLVTDQNRNIRKSLIALGEYRNLDHAREILGMLFMQAGNPVYSFDRNNQLSSAFGDENSRGAASDVLTYIAQYSNPVKVTYSWNRTLPSSQRSFIASNLGVYLGYSSEVTDIRTKNFNLNFDIAPVPQIAGSALRTSFGKLYGFSIARSSLNPGATFTILMDLISYDAHKIWVERTKLPPVRRDVLAQGTTDPYMAIFYDSALIARGWVEPSHKDTDQAFQNLIESIISGRETINSALEYLDTTLSSLTQRLNVSE